MSKKIYILFGLFVVAALLLAACGNGGDETTVATEPPTGGETDGGDETAVVEPPDDDVVAPPPTTRVGGWLDMIIVVEEVNPESAVARLLAGELDIYAYTVNDGNVFETVKASEDLKYVTSAGNFNELAFNIVGPEFNDTGKLNPFSSERVRHATGMLIDRDYIVDEIIDGLGIAKFTNMNSLFPDYARNVAVVKEMEALYAYNPEKAAEIITEEMEAMGATFEDGAWMYNGEQVEIILLIRIEDERLEIGDYVANLFEDLGFAAVRDYKSAADAAPIRDGDPHAGLWHIYTGGWISTSISRNDGYDYGFFDSDLYFTDGVYPYHDTQNPEYDEAMLKLWNSEFSSMEERGELMATCIRGFMKYASRIMLFDATSFTPMRKEVEVTADLAGAVAGADIWPYTLRRTGEVGGAMTVAMPSILTQPWNPVGGSSWVYDQALFVATQNLAIFNDPFTGLGLPQMLTKAEVFIEEGNPVGVTLDWVTLEFLPEIVVPDDAWADWDAETQTFLTVADVGESGRTAAAKYVCYFREDLFETTWHDGSLFSMGDVLMAMIMNFDPAKEASEIYNEDLVSGFNAFMDGFKGWKIASTDPLVVEFYTNNYEMDAEEGLTNGRCGYPVYSGYAVPFPWHGITLGYLAEAAGLSAFDQAKALRIDGEWLSYVAGPSLEILAEQLEFAATETYIPYAPTLGEYVTAEEAATRWANYQDWATRKQHYWVGNGPYYLENAFPVEGTVILKHFANFPDLADKWSGYAEPKIIEVSVDGPGLLVAGDEAEFTIYLEYKGEPYPLVELDSVVVLVFDATGALVFTGPAEAVTDGEYTITVSADVTGAMTTGSSRVEVIAVSKLVSIPTSGVFEFVVE